MADKDTKQVVVQKLVDNEIERLKHELDENIMHFCGEEQGLPSQKRKVRDAEIRIDGYNHNIDDIRKRIALL